MNTGIEWTERTWNPLGGCTKCAPGCLNCYAERMTHRLAHNPATPQYAGLTDAGGRWTGEVRLFPEKLGEPLHWRNPCMCFVNSMSDLFHPDVPFNYIAAVFGIMAATSHVTFQVLTKRPERAKAFAELIDRDSFGKGPVRKCLVASRDCLPDENGLGWPRYHEHHLIPDRWPLPNVWLGASASTQADLDRNVPHLLRVPAAVRFLSLEPLLEAVDFSDVTHRSDAVEQLGRPALRGIGWVIVGGESGPKSRPCNHAWIRSVVQQCAAADVPCFVKQLGANAELTLKSRKGSDPSEWPEDLRVRQFPEVRHA